MADQQTPQNEGQIIPQPYIPQGAQTPTQGGYQYTGQQGGQAPMQQPQQPKKKGAGRVVLIVVVVIVILLLGSCAVLCTRAASEVSQKPTVATETTAPAEGEEADEAEAPAAEEPADYTISDEAVDDSNPYAYTITGILTNNTDRDKEYLQITYILYDADGNQIGTAFDNINSLKAGGTWRFSATGLGVTPDEVGSYEFDEVTGW